MATTPTPQELNSNAQKAINDLLKGGGVKRMRDGDKEVEAFELDHIIKAVDKLESKTDREQNGIFSAARFESN